MPALAPPTEAARPLPPRHRLRSPHVPEFSDATSSRRWAWANALMVSADARTNRPMIQDCNGVRRLNSPHDLADYLVRAQISVTASTDGQLALLWRLFPPGFWKALAHAPPGAPVMYEGVYWRVTGDDNITAQRGQSWGRLANIGRLLPGGYTLTPTTLAEWSKGFFNSLDAAGFTDVGGVLSPGAIGEHFLLAYAPLPDLRKPGLDTAHLQRAQATDKG